MLMVSDCLRSSLKGTQVAFRARSSAFRDNDQPCGELRRREQLWAYLQRGEDSCCGR